MAKNSSRNVLLGIFVITGMIIFVAGVYFIGARQNLFGNTTRIHSVFKNVNGLQLGNNVRYSGVNVGTVKGITILNDTAILVDMVIDDKAIALIRKNSQATTGSDGLVGSMIINIIPGNDGSTQFVKAGDTIPSISKIATADMLTTLNITNENAALLTADLLKITTAINKGEGVLGGLIKDDAMYTDFKQSIANLNQTSRAALTSVNRLNKILAEVNYKESAAHVLLSDTVAAGKISSLLNQLEESSREIHSITENLNEFSVTLKEGEGALNFVMKDTTFANNLDNTLQNVEEASVKFNENMEALKHNFFFRGYFRKLERQQLKQEKENEKSGL
ncbi:MCE family protein [Antarcticibacterium arcticum]|uniref:MCE family protein n=1 Tax=Antarcticibacterium arcticum TaxID=2585771 RepID=A0A5B8YF98_9FLAO|nr:MlaD family protein [Antarcticibacterium arcticum]QED36585.1 MCE family protein [Antarcticibacterium arcticum]